MTRHLSSQEVARLLTDQLSSYLADQSNDRVPVLRLPNVDPFEPMQVGQAIATSYAHLQRGEAQAQWREGMKDALALPGLPAEGLAQILLALSFIDAPELLGPMVEVLIRRTDLTADERHVVFRAAVNVCWDMPAHPSSIQAACALARSPQFPVSMIFDVFDLAAMDPRAKWWEAYRTFRSQMVFVYNTRIELNKVHELDHRLRISAARLAKLSTEAVGKGAVALGWWEVHPRSFGYSLEDRFSLALWGSEEAPFSRNANELRRRVLGGGDSVWTPKPLKPFSTVSRPVCFQSLEAELSFP